MMKNTDTTTTFQPGNVYSTGEARDYVWRFKVIKRTAKFITIADIQNGETRRVGVTVWNGVEHALPLGSYSMAPGIAADRVMGA
jgi:hypothetical protein